jgi:hypothetical protein
MPEPRDWISSLLRNLRALTRRGEIGRDAKKAALPREISA